MKIVLWVLGGIAAFVLLGAVVLPVLGWLLHTLAWVAAGALVIGAGVVVAGRTSKGSASSGEVTATRT